MDEEKDTAFIDRLAMSKPEEISREDLLRYLDSPQFGMGITPTVRKALRQCVEAMQEPDWMDPAGMLARMPEEDRRRIIESAIDAPKLKVGESKET